MKSLNLLLSFMLIAPISTVLADDSAKSASTTTNAAGTTVTTEMSHNDTVGIAGTKKSVEDEKTVVDPKGLMNKTTSKTHAESKVKPNGDYAETKVIDHANGTTEKVTAEKSTAKHWTDNGKTTTTTKTHVVDPAGLGNKKKVEIQETVNTNPDGTEKKTVTKQVDGDTVSESSTVSR